MRSLIPSRDIKKHSKDSINRLSLISCLISERPVILAHNSLIADEWLKEHRARLEDKILVVCYNGLLEDSLSIKADVKVYIAAASDLTIAAAGSFSMMRKKKKQVADLLRKREQELIGKSKKLIGLQAVKKMRMMNNFFFFYHLY